MFFGFTSRLPFRLKPLTLNEMSACFSFHSAFGSYLCEALSVALERGLRDLLCLFLTEVVGNDVLHAFLS